jgi:hypothetical protein
MYSIMCHLLTNETESREQPKLQGIFSLFLAGAAKGLLSPKNKYTFPPKIHFQQ